MSKAGILPMIDVSLLLIEHRLHQIGREILAIERRAVVVVPAITLDLGLCCGWEGLCGACWFNRRGFYRRLGEQAADAMLEALIGFEWRAIEAVDDPT